MSLLKTNEIQNYNGSSLTLTASTVSTSAQLNTGGNISVTGSLNVSDDSTTRTNLGLGTIATQDSDSITVTGGTATLGALTVSGSDSGDLVRITQTGSGNALVVEDSTNPDSTPFVVGASGNVGIGSSPTSTANLYVYSGTDVDMDSSGSGQIRIGGNGYSGAIALNSDGMNIYTNSVSRELIFGVNETEVMRVTDGNVGIGKEIPATALHVDSGTANTVATFESSDSNAELIIKDLNQQSEILVRSAETRITVDALNEDAGSYFTVFVDNDEKIRIDSSGNLLVGYTSSNGSYKLQVNSQIYATSSTIATSDFNYKENITPLDGALSLVSQLNPVQFDWKEHPVHEFDRNQPTVGFIAQEVQQVLSDQPYVNSIVKSNECIIEPEEIDEEGNVIKEAVIEEFLGIAEGNMIALLTKAIQEQQTLIESQQSQIDALTARIEVLEATP